jgi:competence protein ComEA
VDRGQALARDWRFEVRAIAVVVVVGALLAGFVWYRVSSATGDPPPRAPGAAPTGESAAATGGLAPTTTAVGGSVTVHVAGAVRHAGVVVLPAGARVIDAVEAVGGGVPEADLDRLNLAARLADGQRVYVARVGEPAGPEESGASTPEGSGALLNLNTATAAQLETLPGIGPVLADAIVVERGRRGGFRSVNELREVRGIGERRFADLRARVTV